MAGHDAVRAEPALAGGRAAGRNTLALAVILSSQAVLVIDASIVNVALPAIRDGLHLSVSALTWTVNAYTLTFGGLLLLGGRIGDLLGHRLMLACSMVIFSAASLAGGLATSGAMLFAARAAQGTAAAAAAPAALALLMARFPEGRPRDRALGGYVAVSGAGMAAGLLLGGMLTSWLSWRWVLFVNVPVGAAIAASAPIVFGRRQRQRGRLDVAGAVTATLSATAAVNGFVQAASAGWNSIWVAGSFTAALVLAAGFVMVERRAAYPLVPLMLFRSRARTGGYLARFLLNAAMSGMLFLLTLYMENALGYSPLATGLAYLPSAISIVVASRVAPRLLASYGSRSVLVIGTVIIIIGLAWLSRLSGASGYPDGVAGPTVLFGIGTGLVLVAVTRVALAGVAPRDAGVASALLPAMQQIGGSLGVAVLVTVFAASRVTGWPARSSAAVMAPALDAAYLTALGFAVLLLCMITAIPGAGGAARRGGSAPRR